MDIMQKFFLVDDTHTHTHTYGDEAITMRALQRSIISPNFKILNAGGVVMRAFLVSIPPLIRENPFL